MLLLFGMATFMMNTANSEGFLAKDFLELPDTNKKFWIQGAMHALGAVAAAKSEKQGNCVYDWYFGDQRAERNGLILASMEKYPDAYPIAILLALTERECGEYRK